jgi:methylase of polypeptide subunit release factors
MDGLDMLEIGSGTGITGLYLCKTKNLNSILLGDINHHAVSNTLENIELLDLKDKASVIESNVFDNVPKDKKFDIVYWNYPWLPEHKGYEYVDEVERGLFDPDYMYLKKYIKGARAFLKEKGRVFLGFGDFGDLDYLTHLAKREGYILKKMVSKVGDEGGDVKFILFELIPEESA